MTVNFDADAALRQLGELVRQHGPDAVNIAAQVVQVNAVGQLIGGAVSAGVAIAAGYFGAKVMREAVKAGAKYEKATQAWFRDRTGDLSMPSDTHFGLYLLGGTLVAVATVCTITALGNLADIWTWTGIFNPRLALAHDIYMRLAR